MSKFRTRRDGRVYPVGIARLLLPKRVIDEDLRDILTSGAEELYGNHGFPVVSRVPPQIPADREYERRFTGRVVDVPLDKVVTEQTLVQEDKVRSYEAAIAAGEVGKLMPVDVARHQGFFLLLNGNHRMEAARRAGLKTFKGFVLK